MNAGVHAAPLARHMIHTHRPGVGASARGALGSRVFSIKVPATLIEQVDRTVDRFVYTRRQAPITRNEFIRRSIEEKLEKLRRSARHRRRPHAGTLRRGGNTALPGNGFSVAFSDTTTRQWDSQLFRSSAEKPKRDF